MVSVRQNIVHEGIRDVMCTNGSLGMVALCPIHAYTVVLGGKHIHASTVVLGGKHSNGVIV